MRTLYSLDYSEARSAVDLILEKAVQMQKSAVVAVADAHGDLICFARMDGAPVSSILIAINKAWTAARERKPTKEIGDQIKHPEKAHDIAYYGDPKYVGWGGGIPVWKNSEVVGAVAPGAKIVVYFAPNTDAGFLDAINQAVNDTVNKPSILSISWGGPESSWTAQSLQSFNSALQSAAAVGVSVCVAAGDDGSTDGVTDGEDHVDFPASSPYALACGGTTLKISGSTISSEVVWNDLSSNDGATGGGVSGTFPIPTWQANANVPPSTNPSGFAGRGMPDVAGDADPATGYQIEADGQSFAVGGTSAVAPLWAGLIALFNQSQGKSLGYLNPTLYQNVGESGAAFHDITSGNNGDYKAAIGWDPCTGWGSPNGATLLTALSGSAPSPDPSPTPNPKPKPKPTHKHKH